MLYPWRTPISPGVVNLPSGGGSGHTPPLNADQLPVESFLQPNPDNFATLALLTLWERWV
jgi:hypothetical protein